MTTRKPECNSTSSLPSTPNVPRGVRPSSSPTWTSGAQRLVKAADIANDPLRAVLAEAPAHRQERHGGDARRAASSSPCYVPRRSSSSPAPCISARRWRRSAKLLGYDVTIVDPRTAFAIDRALPRREGHRRMAGQGAAAARHRPLHRVRRADPRPEDRRSRAHARAGARLLLYRRARLAEDPRAPRRAAQGSRA